MPRYANPVTQYFDNSGDILSGGKLKFTSPGSDTLKDTYTTAALSSANTNPVVLDSAGRHSDIWLSGTYRVTLLDSSDVQIWQRDPVGQDNVDGPWDTWSSGTTYSTNDIVTGSNGANYRSLVNSNSSNDPTTSPVQWEQVNLLPTWNTNRAYSEDDVVLHEGNLWRSTANSNSGNTPTGKTNWTLGVLTPVVGLVSIPNQTTNVAVTGIGFKPRLVTLEASLVASNATYTSRSSGYGDGTNNKAVYTVVDGTTHTGGSITNMAYRCSNASASVLAGGTITSLDADGFTIDPDNFTTIASVAIYTCYP